MDIEDFAKSCLESYGIKTNYLDLNGMYCMHEFLYDAIDRAILTTERKCWLLRKFPKLWDSFVIRSLWCCWCEISSFLRNEIKYFRQRFRKR